MGPRTWREKSQKERLQADSMLVNRSKLFLEAFYRPWDCITPASAAICLRCMCFSVRIVLGGFGCGLLLKFRRGATCKKCALPDSPFSRSTLRGNYHSAHSSLHLEALDMGYFRQMYLVSHSAQSPILHFSACLVVSRGCHALHPRVAIRVQSQVRSACPRAGP